MDVPDDKIAERLGASVEDILAQGKEPVREANDGADIEATILASRKKLRDLNMAGALDVLQAKIAEERQAGARRLVRLLKEQAAVERLAFDHEAAKRTLIEVTRLTPNDAWAFMYLGDLHRLTGSLEEAAKAFRDAEAAARRQGDERDLSVTLVKLGDVQRAQGDRDAALKSYNDGLAIAYRLAVSDRDLSVCYDKVGDVQMDQGNLDGALDSYQDSLIITYRLSTTDRGNTEWQRDLSASYDRVGNV
jgi:tetratricopeptide (TPR) repeat protein